MKGKGSKGVEGGEEEDLINPLTEFSCHLGNEKEEERKSLSLPARRHDDVEPNSLSAE